MPRRNSERGTYNALSEREKVNKTSLSHLPPALDNSTLSLACLSLALILFPPFPCLLSTYIYLNTNIPSLTYPPLYRRFSPPTLASRGGKKKGKRRRGEGKFATNRDRFETDLGRIRDLGTCV